MYTFIYNCDLALYVFLLSVAHESGHVSYRCGEACNEPFREALDGWCVDAELGFILVRIVLII